MSVRNWLPFGASCLYAILVHWAWAQQTSSIQRVYSQPPSSSSADAAPSSSRGSIDFSKGGPAWLSNMQGMVVFNRSLPAPYRVAVPLMSLGNQGPQVMITYSPGMGNTGQKGLVLFVVVEMP
jgi:hypothetical protein